MGSLYRSEEMCLGQLYLQSEAAFSCVSELGELGIVQFEDLNPNVNAFQRKFVNEVRRCDEMERKLRFLDRELKKDSISIDDNGENPQAPLPREMIDLETKFEKLENDMKEVNANQEALKRNFLELNELKHILLKTQGFFEEMENYESYASENVSSADQPMALRFRFVAGVILREKIPAFERILWRACHSNVFLRHVEIDQTFEDPRTGDTVHKNVFIIFFQGDQLRTRVKKICEGFQATTYDTSEVPAERVSQVKSLSARLEDIQMVLNQTEDHRRLVLSQVALNLRIWFIKVRKIKAIYHTLNMFNVNIAEKCLIAECWCPVSDLDEIEAALRRGTESSGSSIPSIMQKMKTDKVPPTYNRTDIFTSGFQGIIDAYGIADYREINPTPFAIITFPFVFAVMFGDLGHGFLMFCAGLYLVVNQKKFLAEKSDNEIWLMMFGGRYIILLMGIFSMYTGFLYNECFSRSINLFGSAWNVSAMNYTDGVLVTTPMLTLDPVAPGVYRGDPYQYGFDPIWQSAGNKITFSNSYKMKGSIILGMSQMMFGLVLAILNHTYFKNYLSIFCEWIPQVIFILCFVGYLCFEIIYKWAVWTDPATAPSLLIGLINMFMFVAPSKADNTWLYDGQDIVQIIVVVLAIVCVPWMLCIKPYILYRKHKQEVNRSTVRYGGVRIPVEETDDTAAILTHDELSASHSVSSVAGLLDEEAGPSSQPDPEFDMTEITIYQIIHTIEYCLNCISHTASYLRLWALSLAHSELSEVLWSMVMHIGLSTEGPLGAILDFLIFWAFSSLTVGILLIMEGLSAFLHALRLHWVEFNSKFYHGQGVGFSPFSFELIIDGRVDD